ncbi:MAG: DNA topoisomerase (ATP-hydrolyzing) subunit A [Spirochaetaceae bacterium]|jgi:DNA gyrase subunit A|nr:DNA topoisomerase (ATP-hydrolyzing) subunit A [Spirochaetaceae bacterium]
MNKQNTGKIIPIAIEDEVKTAYLNYAMSVIVARALPDVRDGLKPVHRRLLYAMDELGLQPNAATKKSARITGDAMGKYHPHGDASLYDALVRMAQDFSLRYPVVYGQGNFGSIDGDPPAASRYTEAKLSAIGAEMLVDLKKDTVDFVPNYDESLTEPLVLPAAVPNLLINGSSGIAVGMATNMAPHNLREVCAAICAVIDNPDITVEELLRYVPGPDFPTGAIIFGRKGIYEAYQTGRGRILIRGKYTVEKNKVGKESIVFTELPYTVNKLSLIEKIVELIRDKVIDGIAGCNDESDRSGLRLVITLKRGASLKIVINQLFQHTTLQSSFSITNLALIKGRPRTLSLKELIYYFIEHRVEVITRRSRFDMKKAQSRVHILEGLVIALANIDEVVAMVRSSADTNAAMARLQERFMLSKAQVQAIVDMRLGRLSGLESERLKGELKELNEQIVYLGSLLEDPHKISAVIKDEIQVLANRYGDARRTAIVETELETIAVEDLIEKEEMVILISNLGYIKRVPVSLYRAQGRGGKGSISVRLTEEDFVEQIFTASSHDYIMFITTTGKAYCMKVHELPEGSRSSKGDYVRSILNLVEGEEITATVSFQQFSDDQFLFMATLQGIVKKVPLDDFAHVKSRGIIAIKLEDGDRLVGALLTDGSNEIVLVSRAGKALRTTESSVRSTGRTSRGIHGMKLTEDDALLSALRINESEAVFLVSEHGFGKRVSFDEFSPHGRATGGQRIYTITEKTGLLAGCIMIREDEDIMCITSHGKSIRCNASTIRLMGRTAQGVRVVNVDEADLVIGVGKIAHNDGSSSIL